MIGVLAAAIVGGPSPSWAEPPAGGAPAAETPLSRAVRPPGDVPEAPATPPVSAAPAPAAVAAIELPPRWRAAPADVMPPFDAARARLLYERGCRLCHGPAGGGDGAAARWQSTPPRNFTRGVFKFRSTPSGDPPTPGDVYRTLSRGVPGTSMLAWSGLPESDRWQLVGLLLSWTPAPAPPSGSASRPASAAAAPGSEATAVAAAVRVLVIPPAPAATPALVARGADAYRAMRCAECHGDDGRGHGPSARGLRDDDGGPSSASDLTRRRSYRGGAAADDIYRTLMTGLSGTPMPSYAATLSEAQGLALAAYLRSLIVDGGDALAASAAR